MKHVERRLLVASSCGCRVWHDSWVDDDGGLRVVRVPDYCSRHSAEHECSCVWKSLENENGEVRRFRAVVCRRHLEAAETVESMRDDVLWPEIQVFTPYD